MKQIHVPIINPFKKVPLIKSHNKKLFDKPFTISIPSFFNKHEKLNFSNYSLIKISLINLHIAMNTYYPQPFLQEQNGSYFLSPTFLFALNTSLVIVDPPPPPFI